MNSLRLWMGDRIAGGATAALAGWFVALQLFLAAFGCGVVLAGGPHPADPLFVLCKPGTANSEADRTGGRGHECPCGICQTQLPDLDPGTAFLAGSLRIEFPEDPGEAYPLAQRIAPLSRSADGLPPSPRGPPAISS